MSIGKIAKIEFDSRTIEPVERNLVDSPGALASIHRGSKMPWRVHMGSVVRRDGEKFHSPCLAARQLIRFESWKHPEHSSERLLVIGVLDARPKPRRVRGHCVLKRSGKVNESHGRRLTLVNDIDQGPVPHALLGCRVHTRVNAWDSVTN